MSILRDFGLENLAQELLAGDGVHSLGNFLLLGADVHSRFDCLELWFEGTGEVRYSWVSRWYQSNTYTAQPLHSLRFS